MNINRIVGTLSDWLPAIFWACFLVAVGYFVGWQKSLYTFMWCVGVFIGLWLIVFFVRMYLNRRREDRAEEEQRWSK